MYNCKRFSDILSTTPYSTPPPTAAPIVFTVITDKQVKHKAFVYFRSLYTGCLISKCQM